MVSLGSFEFKPNPGQIDIGQSAKIGESEVFSKNSNKRYGMGSGNEEINVSGVFLNQSAHNIGNDDINQQKNELMNIIESSPINTFESPTTGTIETIITNISFSEEQGNPLSVSYEINLLEV